MKPFLKTVVVLMTVCSVHFSTAYADNQASYSDRDDEREMQDFLMTLSNDANKNELLVFHNNGKGNLKPYARIATGGKGTGAGLGNQGALALSSNHRYLFAVNPGSNDVSVFGISRRGIQLLDRAAEPGVRPVSVTVSHNKVYVVNAGDDSIFGYQFNPRKGKLKPLVNSYQHLSGTNTGPAQISFGDEGEALVVTEKATNKITTFTLDDSGIPDQKYSIDSAGKTPFGFTFGKMNQFFVSEAEGGAPNLSSASAYQLGEDGKVDLLNGPLKLGETAACWLATTPNGRVGFTTNTGSDSISSIAIDMMGTLSLLQAKAAQASGPLDLAVSKNGKMLYSLNGGDDSISAYKITGKGVLSKISDVKSIPDRATGLIVF